MKVAFHTLGCKVNQYETAAIAEQFQDKGYQVVEEQDVADVYVINTCTVTGLADRKSRQFIRRAKKVNPESIVAVTGCYAQLAAEEIAQIPEVDIIAGTNEKHRLLDYITDFRCDDDNIHVRQRQELATYEEQSLRHGMGDRTRAYIKIEEGCDRFCSYCVIPYARGPVRSRTKEAILQEAKTLVSQGYREITLTGINTALYEDLPGLLQEIETIEGDFRIRLSSLEPTVVNKDFVKKLFPFTKLCHHLHLSMQSGSDKILHAMNRKYTREEYFAIVDQLREFDPLYGITTDIIAGFPGETEGDFADSLEVIHRCDFAKVHGFRYSERPGTKAAAMKGKVDPALRKERVSKLTDQGDRVATEFFKKHIGTVQKVIFETGSNDADGFVAGYADNYVKVYHQWQPEITQGFYRVRITGLYKDGITGKIVIE